MADCRRLGRCSVCFVRLGRLHRGVSGGVRNQSITRVQQLQDLLDLLDHVDGILVPKSPRVAPALDSRRSFTVFFMMFSSAVTGKLFDNYGPRVPIAIGTLVHTFGLMMASISHDYYQFMLSQSVCSGLGCALIFTPAMAAPYTWFRRRKAITSGLTVAGSSTGGVVFPLMVQHLIPRVEFGWAMRICAFLVLVMLMFANLTVSSHMEHRPKPMKIRR